MKFKNYTKTAFKNLKRRKMRTFLTSFAVSIGTMLIILMVSLGVGVQKLVIDAIKAETPGNSITVNPYKFEESGIKVEANMEEDPEAFKPKFTILDEKAIDKIKNIKSVEEVVAITPVNNIDVELMGKNKNKASAVSFDLNNSIFSKAQVESVRIKEKKKDLEPITYGSIITNTDKSSVLIGEKLLKKLGIDDYKSVVGQDLTIKVQLPDAPGIPKAAPFTLKLKVAGVVGEKFPNSDKVIMSIEESKDLLAYTNMNKNYYQEKGPSNLEVTVKNISDVSQVSDEISKMGYGVTSIQSLIKGIKSFFAIAEGVLAVVGIIIIFVASIGVINTMTMSIYERTRSIGIMKALGSSRSDIRRMFITESAAIGFIGGIMGLLFSIVNTKIIKLALEAFLKSKGVKEVPNIFSTPLWLVLGTIGFAILISVLAGLYPANKASKLDPVESLRYE